MAKKEEQSLLALNDDCIIELFKYLNFDDSITLSCTCKRLQKISAVALKKYNIFIIDKRLSQKGIEHLENIFNAIGSIMSDLTVNFDSLDRSLISDILVKVIEKCSNLETLSLIKLSDFDVEKFEQKTCQLTNKLLNVKELKTVNCGGCIGSFCGLIRELEALEVSYTICLCATQQLLKNNSTIRAITLSNISTNFDLNMVELTPRIEFVDINFTRQETPLKQLTSSVELENLNWFSITLTIPCNIDETLKRLANQKRLEHLICNSIHFDIQTSKTLQSFDQLMMLKLNTDFSNLDTSFVWPANLVILELTSWNEISVDIIISIIQQLKFLQNLALNTRFANEYIANLSYFDDSPSFISKILTALNIGGHQKKLYFSVRAIADTVPILTTVPIVNSEQLSIIFQKPYYIPGDLATSTVMRDFRFELMLDMISRQFQPNITTNDVDDDDFDDDV